MDNPQRKWFYKILTTSRGTINKVYYKDDYSVVEVYCSDGNTLKGEVLFDNEDIDHILPITTTPKGYVNKGRELAHRVIMKASLSKGLVVDHINSNRHDNRKINLRVVSLKENANNRNTSSVKNNTGIVGISKRKHPKWNYEYYRVVVSDRVTPMKGAQSKTKQLSRHFNINVLGNEVAFTLAKEWLELKHKEFGYLAKS